MKKLFTLFALLVTIVIGAKAGDVNVTPVISQNYAKHSCGLVTWSIDTSKGKISSSAIQASAKGNAVDITFTTTKSDFYIKTITFGNLKDGSLAVKEGSSGSIDGTTFTGVANQTTVTITLNSESGRKGTVKIPSITINVGDYNVQALSDFTVSNGTITASKINGEEGTPSFTMTTDGGSASDGLLNISNNKKITFDNGTSKITYIAFNNTEDKMGNDGDTKYTASTGTYSGGAWNGNATSVDITNGSGSGRKFDVIYVIAEAAGPAQTYTVTYKANNGTEEADVVDNTATKAAANTFTAPSGKAFSGWNTSAEGNGDAYAVNDAISTDNLVLYAQWVNVYTQFSMTNITGPTEQVASQDKAPVTATFSTGGSAEVFNAHGSSPATMVLSNTIILKSSGNSYCHVSFPSKLQAGDVIALGETTGNAYLATTSSKPSSKVAIPYTIPANSSLIGATDLYIFNNKDGGDAEKIASFSEFTITGAGTVSNLAVTSSTTPSVNVGETSDITYTSSSTGAITFTTSDANVATVSDAGVITAVGGGTATITINQDADETYRAGYATVTVTVVEIAMIKVKLNGTSDPTVTGNISGVSAEKSGIESGNKFGSGAYVTLTLPTGYTFQAGDILNVNITTASGGGKVIKIYDPEHKDEDHVWYNTNKLGVVGDNKFVLPAVLDGKSSFSICRTSGNQWNAVVAFISVTRPNAVITLNANGYATYSSAKDFEFSGATAYKMALDENAKTITGTAVTGKIKAGEGILFKGEANAKVSIIETTGATALAGNSLKGTTTASGKATVPTYCYTLSGDTFKKFKGDAFNDNKAYLESTQDLSGQSFEIIFDDQPTAISFVVEDDANVVAAPVKTIKNGQLFIGNYNVAGQQVK